MRNKKDLAALKSPKFCQPFQETDMNRNLFDVNVRKKINSAALMMIFFYESLSVYNGSFSRTELMATFNLFHGVIHASTHEQGVTPFEHLQF